MKMDVLFIYIHNKKKHSYVYKGLCMQERTIVDWRGAEMIIDNTRIGYIYDSVC